MSQFFVPDTRVVDLDSGRKVAVVRGVRTLGELDPELTGTLAGTRVGIKPVSEMTDDDWRGLGKIPQPTVEVPVSVKSTGPRVVSDAAPVSADKNPRGSAGPEETA